MMGIKAAQVLALVTLACDVAAFGILKPRTSRSPMRSELRMAKDSSSMKSGAKQIFYDEKQGRFFESNKDAGECIPDEEFCVVDRESGAMIRLTVEEKERIFLDSLQVRRVCSTHFVFFPCE
jgi:hypothetical protein